jgi:hypothetical protein
MEAYMKPNPGGIRRCRKTEKGTGRKHLPIKITTKAVMVCIKILLSCKS